MFPLNPTTFRHPLPHANGPTVSEYYEVIRLPDIDVYALAIRLAERPLNRIGLTLMDGRLFKALAGSPKFLTLLFIHTTPFDPGRPLMFLPKRTPQYWLPTLEDCRHLQFALRGSFSFRMYGHPCGL